MSLKYLVVLGGCLLGCGTVVPLQSSERAVVGWTGSGFKYCMEPVGIERAPGNLVMAYGVGQPNTAAAKDGAPAPDQQAQLRAKALADLTLYARESLYRICEARRNGDMTADAAVQERRELTAILFCLSDASASQPSTTITTTTAAGTETKTTTGDVSKFADCFEKARHLPPIPKMPDKPASAGTATADF